MCAPSAMRAEPALQTPGGAGQVRLWPLLLVAALVLARAAVLLTFDISTQDGPNHLSAARVLAEPEGTPVSQAFERAFRWDFHLSPTWTPELCIAGLMRWLGPLDAERAFLLLYLMLYASGALALMRALAPRGAHAEYGLALFLLPYGFAFPFHMGFWGYQLALALLLHTLAFYARSCGRFSWSHSVRLAVLALAIFFSHPFPLLALFLVMACSFVARARERATWRSAALEAASLLPAIALLARFLVRNAEAAQWEGSDGRPWQFLNHSVLGSFDADFGWLGAVWLGLLGVALAASLPGMVSGRKSIRAASLRWPLFACALFWPASSLLSPDRMFHGRQIATRAEMLFGLSLVAFLATHTLTKRFRGAVFGLGFLVASALLALEVAFYRRVAPLRREYLELLDDLPPGSSLLTFNLTRTTVDGKGHRVSDRVRPFLHLSGVVAAQRGLVDLTNIQATADYSPVRWLARTDPYRRLAIDLALEARPPRFDLDSYHTHSGISVDYILLWQLEEANLPPEDRAELLAQIDLEYELERTSEPNGMGRLYRRVRR